MSKRRRPPTLVQSALVRLTEDVRARPASVDTVTGVIHGVKVLGLTSINRRRYTSQAVQNAARLYENRGVYADHPSKPTEQRSIDHKIGWLENVQARADGLYADLHLLLADERTAKVLEAAQKKPELFGLSHNADGKGKTDADGIFVVEEITEVRSVDLVADPATNRSLFEGARPIAKITVAALFESLSADKRLSKFIRKQLLEMEDCPVVEMDEPAAETSPEDQLTAGFKAAMSAIIDGEGSAADKAKKLAEYLKTHEKLLGGGKGEGEASVAEGDDEPDGDEDDSDDYPKDSKESRKPGKAAPGTVTLTEAKAKRLCTLAGVACDARLLESLTSVGEEAGLKIIEWAKEKGTAPQPARGPRSQPAHAGTGRTTTAATNGKDFAARICG